MKDPESIIVDYTLNEAPEQIWRALTDPKLLAQWLMENDIDPTVGHKFKFRAKPMGDWDGIVHCEVLEVDPPAKFVYSSGKVALKKMAQAHASTPPSPGPSRQHPPEAPSSAWSITASSPTTTPSRSWDRDGARWSQPKRWLTFLSPLPQPSSSRENILAILPPR